MAKTYSQLVREARAAVKCTTTDDLHQRMEAGEHLVLIDVREPPEWAQGTLPGAHRIPRGVLEGQVEGRVLHDATVVLYCGGGGRSALAAKSLAEMGYAKVESLDGGFSAWAQSGLPLDQQ